MVHTNHTKSRMTSLFININSNHPSDIIKQIPTIISKRISEISSNEEIFKNAAPYYENALEASGHQQKLSYQSEILNEGSRRNRSRNIIWSNPPFSTNVTSNIAREFLYLINKHFPKKHRLHKLFNRNNVKYWLIEKPVMRKATIAEIKKHGHYKITV